MPGKSNRLLTTRIVGQMVDAYYDEVLQARGSGKKVGWWFGFPMFPLLRAQDIVYLHGEGYAARVAGRKEEKALQTVAEDDGWSMEACSYARCHIGGSILAQKGVPPGMTVTPLANVPPPDFLISCNPGCSTEIHWFDHIRRRFNVPGFHITVPHNWLGTIGEKEEATQEVLKQLQDCVQFLEDMTGRPYNWEKLKAVMRETQLAATSRKEAMLQCRNIPAPATFFDWAVSLAPVNILQGAPGTADYFAKVKEEIEGRVARKEGAVPGERFRLYWDGIMVWNRLGWLAEKFASFESTVVCGRYTHLGFLHRPEFIDPEKPLESLAANVAWLQINQSLDTLTSWISELCEYYRIDGIVAANMRTCRPFAGMQLEVIDGVARRLGIPATYFDADMTDANFISDAQVDTKLQALLETITARRRVRA